MEVIAGLVLPIVTLAICAFVAYHRFTVIALHELAGYTLQPEPGLLARIMAQTDEAVSKTTVVILGLTVWAIILMWLHRSGRQLLFTFNWSIGLAIAFVAGLRKNLKPLRCQKCGMPMQIFRKKNLSAVPAIFYLHVCHRCRQYRERLVTGLIEGG